MPCSDVAFNMISLAVGRDLRKSGKMHQQRDQLGGYGNNPGKILIIVAWFRVVAA